MTNEKLPKLLATPKGHAWQVAGSEFSPLLMLQ